MGFQALPFIAMGIQGGANIAGGIATQKEKKAEAAQYENNARLAKIGADQESVARLEDYRATISSINAIRTARGLDVTSPTGVAIADRTATLYQRGDSAQRLNAANQAQGFRNQASIARSQGTMSLLSGFLQAGTTIAKGPGSGGWS